MPIQQVIKYEGDNQTFVWKHPAEDFNTHSQLIVHESQEAVFFLNGQPMDLFGPGRYTLETQNIPVLRHVINIPTGGVSPFHCEVYFINKVEQMAIPWGTDSKIQYIEPKYGFPISIGAGGEMSLRVADSKKLLINLVGTENSLSRENLVSYFRAFLMIRIKTYLAQVLKQLRISVFEVDEHLTNFSNALKKKLTPDFADYGIALEQFFVTRIVKPDGDPQYEKFKELYFRQYADIADAKIKQQVGIINQQTESQKMVIEAKGIAEKRKVEGYSYQQQRGFDIAEKAAQNEGAGNFSSAGIGLGMIAGIGNTIGKSVGKAFHDAIDNDNSNKSILTDDRPQYCEECGAKLLPGAKFCDSCGHPVTLPHKCSVCGYVFERPGKFCPHCGAKRSDN